MWKGYSISMDQQNTQFLGEKLGEGMTYGGAASAGVAWGLSLNEMAALGGLLFAILGYFTSLYFARKRNRREEELHILSIKVLEDKPDD